MVSKPILIGIIIDVSNSMRRNWDIDKVRKTPKIVTVRDALNRQFDKVHTPKESSTRSVQIFCIGMGFKRKMLWNRVDLSYREERTRHDSESKTDCSVICDLLALAEMVPADQAICKLEDAIRTKWTAHAGVFIAQAQSIDDSIFDTLEEYIRLTIGDKPNTDIFLRLSGVLSMLISRLPFLARLNVVRRFHQMVAAKMHAFSERARAIAKAESRKYVDMIANRSRKLLRAHKGEYKEIIEETIRAFAEGVADQATELVTLGFSFESVLSIVDESEVRRLATVIYNLLQKKIEANILLLCPPAKARLRLKAEPTGSSVDWDKVESLTVKCIQRHSWSILERFTEDIVADVFTGSFRKAVIKQLPNWLGLASCREIVRTPGQIVNVLPDDIDNDIYSDKFMFGATPINRAIQMAALRLMDRSKRRRQKLLVIISDGEFDTGKHLHAARLLKREGVTIVSLCLYRKSITTRLKESKSKLSGWPTGAKLMLDMASTVPSGDDSLVPSLVNLGYEVPGGVKLFYQIDQSALLDDIFGLILQRWP